MYSQNDEEKIIREYFEAYYPNQKGTVLDIGANDGVTLSNSRMFIDELGWGGHLVEAARTPYGKLEALYKDIEGVRTFNVALGRENGELTFYESGNLLNEGDVGLVSSLVPAEINRWKNSGVPYTEYPVKCMTWKTFYNKCCANMKWDFISIDIEGMDYEVLSQIDLRAHGCKCLCVEWNGKDKQKFVDYADSHGLTLIDENPENLIFAKVF
jgi:FkbM family methyltransferase